MYRTDLHEANSTKVGEIREILISLVHAPFDFDRFEQTVSDNFAAISDDVDQPITTQFLERGGGEG